MTTTTTTKLEKAEKLRAEIAAEIVVTKVRHTTGDFHERDAAQIGLQRLRRKMAEADNAIKEARRAAERERLSGMDADLAADDAALSLEVDGLKFCMSDLNHVYRRVREKAVALGSRIHAGRHHPLSSHGIDHALQVWVLASIEAKLPGQGDCRGAVLDFRGKFRTVAE